METPIKPGKYKCAAGQKAHILPAPPEVSETDCLVGWVLVKETGKWVVMTWTLNGRFSHKELSQYDISEPWIDAPIFNHWGKVPWAKLVYRYGSNWYATSLATPLHLEGVYRPYEVMCTIQPEDRPIWDGPDKDSLIIRPENV